MPSKLAPNM